MFGRYLALPPFPVLLLLLSANCFQCINCGICYLGAGWLAIYTGYLHVSIKGQEAVRVSLGAPLHVLGWVW